jgi:predicted O-methyltransferase YrrM
MKERRSVDRAGRSVPWFTYPAIDFLAQLDYAKRRVFEYGSGASTLFWAERAGHVVAVESEPAWYEIVRAKAPSNCELILSSSDVDVYAGQIRGRDQFDVVVIDGTGESRPMCCRRALEHVRPGGMIILDNSDLWLKSASILRHAGLIQVDFTGFAPLESHAHTTSVFLTRDFNFEPLHGHQPHKSVAQPVDPWLDEGP